MATLIIDTHKIISNIEKLEAYLSRQGISLTLVTKILCGYRPVLEKIMVADVIQKIHSIADSRISNIKMIKKINPDLVTMYIKPPAMKQARNVVQCADISLNTSYPVISALNEEARKQGKIHKIIAMLEMGELREGINRHNIIEFYERIFELSNIQTIGLGTNLGCMYGVEPTYDKLIQLSLFKQLIEAKFNKKIDLISGGSSITLPIIPRKKVPKDVNHFRIGETAFLGNSLATGKKFKNLSTAAFDFSAEILELEKKETQPDGQLSDANIGHTPDMESPGDGHKQSYRCIVDFGELDVDVSGLDPKDKDINFAGTTSDMTVYDIGADPSRYRVGKQLHFTPNYIAIARIMNSSYVTKVIK